MKLMGAAPLSVIHTHNHFMALLDFVWVYLAEPAPERYQSGFTGARNNDSSGISWAICKSAP